MIVLASALVLSLAACGPKKEEPAQPVTQQEENVVEENTTPTLPSEEEKEAEITMLTSSGQFVGKIDSQSVEIKTAEGVATYQLSEEVTSVMDHVKTDTSITFDHYVNENGQNVLVSVTVNEEEKTAEGKTQKEEWVFVGLIDGHSAEFKRGGEFVVAQYNGDGLDVLNQLNENDTVNVEYENNENGQPVIITLTKK